MGAFVGFKRFVVRLDNDQAQLDPEFRFTDLLEAEDSCRSVTFSTYSSTSSTLSACNRASEQRTNQALQSTFDADWSNHCSPVRAKSPFRPTLNDTIAEPPVSEGTLASDQPAAGTTASTPATQTDDEASDEGPAGTDTQAPGGPDQTELDRIFNGPPPKIKVTQPSGHSNDPLEPAPD